MKRLFLIVVAVLSMTATFAKDENVNTVENYDMSVNIRKLGNCLGLTIDQMETVGDVHKTFCAEMMNAATAHADDRQGLVNAAINKDLKYMHYILNDKQYSKYLALLNATITNRGLNK
jgi:hypothetical protein